MRIEGIYEKWVPVPDSRGDRLVFDFLNEVKEVVIGAVHGVEQEVRAAEGIDGSGIDPKPTTASA